MEKGLLFFTLAAGILWLILDEFWGSKKISGIATQLTPDISNPVTDVIDKVGDKVKDTFSWRTLTPEDKEESHKKLKESIDKSDKIKDNETKKRIKEMVDDFYLSGGGRVSS